MEHRGKQVSEWIMDDLTLNVTSTGSKIIGTICRGGVTVYRKSNFVTWNGAINAVTAEAEKLTGKK